MSVTRIGNTTIVQGPTVSKFDPYSGETISTTYEGTEADINNQFFVLANQGWTLEQTTRTADSGENYSSLTAQRVNDFILPPVVWEITDVKYSKNLEEATEVPLIASLGEYTRWRVKHRVDHPSENPKETGKLTELDLKLIPKAEHENAQLLFKMMVVGIVAKKISSVEIKRMQVVPNQYTPTWNLDYTNKVISKSALINLFQVPNYLQGVLPDGNTDIQMETVPPDPQDAGGPIALTSFRGWLVEAPIYQNVARNRIQLSQTFLYDKWSVQPNGIYVLAG